MILQTTDMPKWGCPITSFTRYGVFSIGNEPTSYGKVLRQLVQRRWRKSVWKKLDEKI